MSEARTKTGASEQVLAAVEELGHLEAEDRAAAFRQLPDEHQSAVFERLDPAHQEEVLEHCGPDESAHLVEELEPDDRARLFEQLPDADRVRLRARLSPRQRMMTDQLLSYAVESAGRIMTPEFVTLQEGITAERALAQVRARGRDAETILVLPVLDARSALVGMVTLDELVLARPGTHVAEIMHTDHPVARVEDDQEIIARRLQDADVLALPVVDGDGRLLGIFTVDDAMDVIEQEEAENLARAGAVRPLDRPYLDVSLLGLARSRVVWLLLLAIAAVLTVNVLSAFEELLADVVILALFIPLLIGMGGNVGSQSASTIVRALATGDVRPAQLAAVLLREAAVGLFLGLALGTIAFLPLYAFAGIAIASIVGISLVAICVLAALVGSAMPIVASRLGIDPAVISAPLVTTVVDASGLLIYFFLAHALLDL